MHSDDRMRDGTSEAPAIRLLCWNMGAGGPGPRAGWDDVRNEADIDAAMLQEAPNPCEG